jgi:hypothetical protein
VASGVPQGSVLGPVLFVCFINDVPDTIASFIYMYADDTKIFRQLENAADKDQQKGDLDALGTWQRRGR